MTTENSSPTPRPVDVADYMRAIGHDIGAPIRHIRGFASLLDDEIGTSLQDESRLLLDQIKSSAALAEAMIHGLHDLALLGNRLKFAPDASLRELVERASRQVGSPRLQLTITGNARVYTDQRLMERMLAAFMRNTLSYADEPKMTVTMASDRGAITLKLIDHGPAFEQQEWLKLRLPFKRLGDRPKIDALGLGLTETEHIARLLNVELTAKAIPGKSLEIQLRIPTAADQVGRDPHSASSALSTWNAASQAKRSSIR